jgi:hypothetical protein
VFAWLGFFDYLSCSPGKAFRFEEESALMAVKVVHVSDISGKEADEQSLGQLVVHEHPDDADLPAGAGVMESAVQDALIAKHRSRPRASGTGAGGSVSGGRSGRGKVNYATLEHAGEPHRGRITEAEKELVRKNLDQVNKRLREAGQREINPADQAMRDRYGLE